MGSMGKEVGITHVPPHSTKIPFQINEIPFSERGQASGVVLQCKLHQEPHRYIVSPHP